MDIKVNSTDERELVISTNIFELAELYKATRPGRKTKAQNATLTQFGDLVRMATPDIEPLVADEEIDDGHS